VLKNVKLTTGTPSTLAQEATVDLGFAVTRHDIGRSLAENNLSKKKISKVPGYSVPSERRQYLQELEAIWTSPDQVTCSALRSAPELL